MSISSWSGERVISVVSWSSTDTVDGFAVTSCTAQRESLFTPSCARMVSVSSEYRDTLGWILNRRRFGCRFAVSGERR
jgi:hypothetical protein